VRRRLRQVEKDLAGGEQIETTASVETLNKDRPSLGERMEHLQRSALWWKYKINKEIFVAMPFVDGEMEGCCPSADR